MHPSDHHTEIDARYYPKRDGEPIAIRFKQATLESYIVLRIDDARQLGKELRNAIGEYEDHVEIQRRKADRENLPFMSEPGVAPEPGPIGEASEKLDVVA